MEPRDIMVMPMPVVLFPGMPLPLQVVGGDDSEVLQQYHEEGTVFGAALVQTPAVPGDRPRLHDIGTTARIAGTKEVSEGQLSVLAVGQERFRMLDYVAGSPFFRASVELLGEWEDQPVSSDLAASAAGLFGEYVQLLLTRAGQDLPEPMDLPEDGRQLSYLVAQSLDIGPEEKQGLLEIDSASARLGEEITILRRENSSNRLLLSFRGRSGVGRMGDGLVSLN